MLQLQLRESKCNFYSPEEKERRRRRKKTKFDKVKKREENVLQNEREIIRPCPRSPRHTV